MTNPFASTAQAHCEASYSLPLKNPTSAVTWESWVENEKGNAQRVLSHAMQGVPVDKEQLAVAMKVFALGTSHIAKSGISDSEPQQTTGQKLLDFVLGDNVAAKHPSDPTQPQGISPRE